ncbi:prepilin peptidase [Prochlorococcus marinus]|uniref:Prepilin leader peptidase/N-methyltransferase n=1 Tax=Prochlorococcus marinus XMU1408 TaxID=2213228 RepID=A0A318R1N3_PROMR|nr:A24 family peptidase [Prochlorococcus marinus]PYE01067.1 prepilin peptidase [Prochlorococcus marinus XMU1408]
MGYETYFYLLLTSILGLSIGSFLNVVISRIPNKKSIAFPRSHCPSCKKNLMVFDLIPVISWLILKGKCRYCGQPISYRYSIVETLTSIFFLIIAVDSNYINNNNNSILITIISGWVLISYLLSLTFIDIEHMILPNVLTITGSFLGIIFTSAIHKNSLLIIENIKAYLVGLICFSLLAYFIKIIIGKPALGMGDVKLFAMSGAWLGFSGLEISIVLSFLLAGTFSLIGLIFKSIKRGQYIPFGPFICLSIFLVWLLGDPFWYHYLNNIFWWRII